MADPGSYRPAAEVKAHLAWDPINAAIRNVELRYPSQAELAEVGSDNIGRLTTHMVEAGHLAEAEVKALRTEVQAIVDDAVEFALQSPQPTMEAAWAHMTCNRRHEVLI
jgi:pyruvate dehydrogenase E1 component alpha subunit